MRNGVEGASGQLNLLLRFFLFLLLFLFLFIFAVFVGL
jgi:hypothetical protein